MYLRQLKNFLDDWAERRPRGAPWLLACLSGALLVNAKLFQHFSLQTHAFDLGVFANACWNTLHGNILYDSVKGAPYLADHFQPILILMSPLLLLWNNAAALVAIQSAGLALAVPPLFWLVKKSTDQGALAAALCLLYLTSPFLAAINVFDLHPESLAIPIFLWGLWFLETNRLVAFFSACLVSLLLKEDVPFALTALGLMLTLSPSRRKIGAALAILAIASFIVETQIIIPHFLKAPSSVHLSRYSHLGESYLDILSNIVYDPVRIVHGLIFPAEKWWAFLKYLGSMAFLPLLDPLDFFPGLAALLPHLLSRYSGQYTLSGQYSALSLPFALFASAKGLPRLLKHQGLTRLFPEGSNGASLGISTWLLAGCLLLSGNALLFSSRYGKSPDWKRVKEFFLLIQSIPPEASVRSQSDLLPQVCMRKRSPLFAPYEQYKDLPLFEPSRAETDYILLDLDGNCWPMTAQSFKSEVERLGEEGHYRLLRDVDGFELWGKTP